MKSKLKNRRAYIKKMGYDKIDVGPSSSAGGNIDEMEEEEDDIEEDDEEDE